MMRVYVLYNSKSGDVSFCEILDQVRKTLSSDEEICEYDVLSIENYDEFFANISKGDKLILCGGDGTLNHFVNDTRKIKIECKIFYFPCGTGNDFIRDVTTEKVVEPVDITEYLKDLPVVIVKNKEYVFLNGVGFGIDGYCCETADKIKAKKANAKVNYTAIAIKGLLFHYKTTNATVIVDGKKYEFKKVWLAPTMNGKYYGGGMMPAPDQRRLDVSKKVSTMIFHGSGKLKSLMIFPSIFEGNHVEKVNNVSVFSGHDVIVRFDSPRSLQIDGETVLDVTEYRVKSAMCIAEENLKMRGVACSIN